MWSEAKLGCLLLLGPLRMLKIWYAWTLIMMKWLGLTLGRLEPWLWSFGICLKWLGACTWKAWTLLMVFWYLLEMAWAYTWKACILWVFGLWCCSCLHAPLMGSSVGLRLIQETNWASFTLRLLGLSSFTTYKVQTIMMGSSVGLESSWFKQRPNKCVMQCNLHGPT